jgi:hypothetical protein
LKRHEHEKLELDTLQTFNLGLFFFLIQSIDIGGTMILLMAKNKQQQ